MTSTCRLPFMAGGMPLSLLFLFGGLSFTEEVQFVYASDLKNNPNEVNKANNKHYMLMPTDIRIGTVVITDSIVKGSRNIIDAQTRGYLVPVNVTDISISGDEIKGVASSIKPNSGIELYFLINVTTKEVHVYKDKTMTQKLELPWGEP